VISSPAHWEELLATMTATAKMWVPSLSRSNIGPPLSPTRLHGAVLVDFHVIADLVAFCASSIKFCKAAVDLVHMVVEDSCRGPWVGGHRVTHHGVKKPLTSQVLPLLLIHTTPSTDLPDGMLISSKSSLLFQKELFTVPMK
jgi:hypothetical protein